VGFHGAPLACGGGDSTIARSSRWHLRAFAIAGASLWRSRRKEKPLDLQFIRNRRRPRRRRAGLRPALDAAARHALARSPPKSGSPALRVMEDIVAQLAGAYAADRVCPRRVAAARFCRHVAGENALAAIVGEAAEGGLENRRFVWSSAPSRSGSLRARAFLRSIATRRRSPCCRAAKAPA